MRDFLAKFGNELSESKM